MRERKLILKDGTELEGYPLETGSRLLLYIYNNTMRGVFDKLIEPGNTIVIRSEQNGTKETFRGYVVLYDIMLEDGGMICAGLKKN